MSARDDIAAHFTSGALADELLDAYRAEILREEMRNLRRIERENVPEGAIGTRTGLLKAALILDERAEDTKEKATVPATTATPQFFQPGRIYTDGNGFRAPELVSYFRVEHITRHPDRGHLRAIGWLRSGASGSQWHGDFRDEDEFEDWSDVSEDGAA